MKVVHSLLLGCLCLGLTVPTQAQDDKDAAIKEKIVGTWVAAKADAEVQKMVISRDGKISALSQSKIITRDWGRYKIVLGTLEITDAKGGGTPRILGIKTLTDKTLVLKEILTEVKYEFNREK